MLVRRELWGRGLRYRLHLKDLPGRPDIAFIKERVAIFCDGDFWHGRNLSERVKKLAKGHNADYWVAKVTRNVERDRSRTAELESQGWTVLRFWESDIVRDVSEVADQICSVLQQRKP